MAYMFIALIYIVCLFEKIGIWKLSSSFKWSKTGTKRQGTKTLQICKQNIPGGRGREACTVFTGAGKAAGRVSDWLQRSKCHGLIEHQARSSVGWLGPSSRVEGGIKTKTPSRTHGPNQNHTCNEICLSDVSWGQNGKCTAMLYNHWEDGSPRQRKDAGSIPPCIIFQDKEKHQRGWAGALRCGCSHCLWEHPQCHQSSRGCSQQGHQCFGVCPPGGSQKQHWLLAGLALEASHLLTLLCMEQY